MTIDADVQAIAKTFAHSVVFTHLVQAVVNAEGPGDAIVKAVRCSDRSIQTREQAIRVVCRSAIHMMADFIAADQARRGEFIRAFGAKWAPVGATNDPTGLNGNWQRNVATLWNV